MATSFPEIGVQAVLRDFYIFQRDMSSYNRLINNAMSGAAGATSSLTSIQNLSVQAANAAARADQALTVALEKEAIAAFATERAMQGLQIGSQSRSATAHEEALAHAENAIALQKEASAAAANALQARNTAGAANAALTDAQGIAASKTFLGLAAASALASAAVVAMGVKYQATLDRIQTTMGMTNTQTDGLVAANMRLALSYGETGQASANAELAIARDLSQEEKTPAILNAATDAAEALSKATGADLPSAIKLTTLGINAFQMSAEQARNSADAWTVALNNSNLDARTAAASFGNLVGAAQTLNLTFNQTVALMTTVAQHGDALARNGLDLSRVIAGLVNPSENAVRVLNEQGIVQRNVSDGTINFIATLQRLQTVYGSAAIASGQMTQSQRDQDLAIIGGQSGIRVIGADIDNLTTQFITNAQAAGQLGVAHATTQKNTDNLGGALGRVFALLGTSASTVGKGAADWLYYATQLNLVNEAARSDAEEHQALPPILEAVARASGIEAAAANTAAGANINAASAARERASAERELAAALGQSYADQYEQAGALQAAQIRAAAPQGGTKTEDQVARAAAERDASKAEIDAHNTAIQTKIQLDTAYKLQATQDAKARADISTAASLQEAQAQQDADNKKTIADLNYTTRYNEIVAERGRAGGGGGGAARDAQAADNSARSQIESVDKVKDTFLRDIDQMYNKYADDTKKMAKAFEENYANAVNREMEQLAQAETQIVDAQAAEQLRIAQRAAREELNIKIQAQRDAFDDLKQRAQDAFDFQERLTQDQLSDKIQAERDAFDIQQEMLDKGVDAATIAKTQEAMATAEGNQLKNTHLSAAQKAQIQSDYATNQKLYAQQIASTKATIQKDADKNTAREKFDAQLRAEQEAADDAATLRREAFDRDARTRQEAFDLGIEKEQQALEDQFAQQALDQQIKKIHQHEDAIRAQSVLELEHMRSAYNNEVTARNQALATDLANLEQHFKDEMSQFDQHWADLAAKQIAHDSAISAREAQLTKNEVDNANIAIRAYNAEAEARANALGLAKPNPVAEITAIPEPVQIGHNGLAIGGLPGTEHMIRALAGEMVIQPASLGLSPSNNYNSNTVNNNYAFHANYSHAQSAQELRHDVMAIMALTRGGR